MASSYFLLASTNLVSAAYPSPSPTNKKTKFRPLPALRRTRSWRGVIQVRFDDTRADRNRILRHATLWAPLRLFGIGFVMTTFAYFVLGHDFFLHTLLGYESEMQYEARVNPSINNTYGTLLEKDRAWRSPIRQLEKPLHPKREFDVLQTSSSSPSASHGGSEV